MASIETMNGKLTATAQWYGLYCLYRSFREEIETGLLPIRFASPSTHR
jgi:hypothetical protein